MSTTGDFTYSTNFTKGGYYTGGVITNGGYVTLSTAKPFDAMVFASLCITLGLDTAELRNKFLVHYMNVLSWGQTANYNLIYDHLIQKAYEVKYGTESD